MQRRISALLLVLVLVLTQMVAQRPRMTPQERTDQLASQLSLTKDQKAKVLEVFTKADSSRSAAFSAHRGDREAMREVIQSIREDTDSRLKGILSEEQHAKYLKLREEMQSRRPMAP